MGSESGQDGGDGAALGLRVLGVLVGVVALAHLAAYLRVALGRMDFPFPFDWVEGQATLQSLEMLRGWPPYHVPHVEGVPPIFPPMMAFLVTPWLALGLRSLAVARAVSVASTLGIVALLVAFVRRDGGRPGEAAAAAALFLASYGPLDRVMDMGRVDTPACAFLLLGAYWLGAPGRHRRRTLGGAGALLVATFLKQSLGLCCLAVLGARLARRPREGLRALGAYLAGGLALSALLELWTGGWFLYWILVLPGSHPFDSAKTWGQLAGVMLACFPAPLPLLLLAGLGLRLARPRRAGPSALIPHALAGSALAAGAMTWLKIGGHVNGLIFAVVGLALVAGLLPGDLRRLRAPRAARAAQALVLLVALAGGLQRWTSHQEAVPTEGDRWLADGYRRALAQVGGAVLVPTYPAAAELAGGGPQFSLMPVWDLAYGRIPLPVEQLGERLAARAYQAVLLPREYAPWVPGLDGSYVPAFPIRLPAMRSGNRLPDHWAWLPRYPELQPREVDLRPLLGSRPAGARRRAGPFLVRGDALALRLRGGGDPALEGVDLRFEGRVVRRAALPPGSAPGWLLWDTRDLLLEEVDLEVRHQDPSAWADLILEDVVALALPPALLELADLEPPWKGVP